jgi:SnoaL-like domain
MESCGLRCWQPQANLYASCKPWSLRPSFASRASVIALPQTAQSSRLTLQEQAFKNIYAQSYAKHGKPPISCNDRVSRPKPMDESDDRRIRELLDDYLRMYSSRDDRLTTYFSEDFSGFTGGGDFLVKDREEWVAITRQDFAQIKDPIRIELKDVAIQSLADTIAVATSFLTIHLPIKDHILSRETARLVLIFSKEPADWKISHSSISIPYPLVHDGEVYPLMELVDRNRVLDELVAERTIQLSEANVELERLNRLRLSFSGWRRTTCAAPSAISSPTATSCAKRWPQYSPRNSSNSFPSSGARASSCCS